MRYRRAAAATTALLATIAAASPPAVAGPPESFGPFPIDEDSLMRVAEAVEASCDVVVTDVSGTGAVRYKHFFGGPEGERTRGQGWFHITVHVTTSSGATATIRERSMDTYAGADLVYDGTSGRATIELASIGHLDSDGALAGRAFDVCDALG